VRKVGFVYFFHFYFVIRCVQREAQATVLANLISDHAKDGDEIIMAGDLNDYDNKFLDCADSVPISRVISRFSSEKD